jgi:hypothetical protein
MTTRILTVLVAAILVGGVMTAVLKEDTSKGPVAQQPTPTPIESPTESPTETMTFDGVPPFESPTTVVPTSTPTGGLPVTGGPSAWPPALVALALAGIAAHALRRTDA